MSRGLHKLTNAANTLQAWEDWGNLITQAVNAGLGDADYIDAKYGPNPQDGWRKIDKCIKALREKMHKRAST